jgi:outer membrane protein OmpA-like peptidoglycan-associated protein
VKISNQLIGLAVIVAMSSACGSTAPTQQLVDARRAMTEARESEASELTPDKVLTAQQALERAEQAHEEDAGSDKEAHLAYLASRKARIAMAHGKIAAAKETEMQADAKYQAGLERVAHTSSSELDAAQAALQAEQQRRAEAEKRASAALASLQQVAKVRAESRGTVITLPGGVLFPSGGSDLSPTARVALKQVVEALTQQPIESKIVVEGHTDDRGSDASNQQLSQARADAVRSFLLENGLAADRVKAVGKGESEPIASSDTAEGRATNRRVDLVVSGASSGREPSTARNAPAQPSSASAD